MPRTELVTETRKGSHSKTGKEGEKVSLGLVMQVKGSSRCPLERLKLEQFLLHEVVKYL